MQFALLFSCFLYFYLKICIIECNLKKNEENLKKNGNKYKYSLVEEKLEKLSHFLN